MIIYELFFLSQFQKDPDTFFSLDKEVLINNIVESVIFPYLVYSLVMAKLLFLTSALELS